MSNRMLVGDEFFCFISFYRRRRNRFLRRKSLTATGITGNWRVIMFPESAAPRIFLFLAAISISVWLLYGTVHSFRRGFSSPCAPFIRIFPPLHDSINSSGVSGSFNNSNVKLEKVLENAADENKTVILTTLNEAWAAPNSVIDMFLESFRVGMGTRKLLNHLVIIALDEKAYATCLKLHHHCFPLVTQGLDFHKEAFFMTSSYLDMMWKRIDFLRSVLELGYNFVFTDADIMWFRDPFPRFYRDADFQIACDEYFGSSVDIQNRPNGGFNHVKSNNRSIEFYKFWYSSREIYPGYHDQDVLNFIKFDPFVVGLGLKMKFLDTAYFGGFCEHSKDLNLVCTMHANCCVGLDAKIHDLRLVLQDWKSFLSLPPSLRRASLVSWRVPQKCSVSIPQNSTEVSEEDQGELRDLLD